MNYEYRAKEIAIKAHQSVNHLYDGYLPYEFHLRLVVENAHRFELAIPDYIRDHVFAACWLHDTLEDTHLTYNDLLQSLSVTMPSNDETIIAELVYAVTNDKGRNRKERAGDAYYEGIRETPHTDFVKLMDRLANIQYGNLFGSKMLDMYRKEHTNFLDNLDIRDKRAYKPILDELSRLL